MFLTFGGGETESQALAQAQAQAQAAAQAQAQAQAAAQEQAQVLTFGGGETESQALAQAQAQAAAQAQAQAAAQAQAQAAAQAAAQAQAQAAAQAQAQAAAPSGMLTGMTAQEVLDILPGPGSYYYNLYKAENPELVAAAEAIRNEARARAKRGESVAQPSNGLTFGGSAQSAPAVTNVDPSPTTTTTQQQQLNQNFIKFLEELGLGSLVTAFQSGTTPDLSGIGMMSGGNSGGSYTPYVPLMPTVAPIDFTASVLPKNTVGYDPVRGLYNIPDAQTQQTVTEQTGLFNYIYGPQG
jgi:hypothetical protein